MQLSQPAIELFPDKGEIQLGDTRFGGTPDLPPNRWIGRAMRAEDDSLFLLQINLAQMPRFEGCPLPARGMLWFFVASIEPTRDIANSVFFYDGEELLHPTPQPPAQEFWSDVFFDLVARRLEARFVLGAPLWYCDEYEQLSLSETAAERYGALQRREKYPLAVLGGGVAGIGVDPREAAFLGREVDPAPLFDGRKKEKLELWPMFKWQNLLRLGADESLQFASPNFDYLNFLIHKDDWKSTHFGRLYVEVQSS